MHPSLEHTEGSGTKNLCTKKSPNQFPFVNFHSFPLQNLGPGVAPSPPPLIVSRSATSLGQGTGRGQSKGIQIGIDTSMPCAIAGRTGRSMARDMNKGLVWLTTAAAHVCTADWMGGARGMATPMDRVSGIAAGEAKHIPLDRRADRGMTGCMEH